MSTIPSITLSQDTYNAGEVSAAVYGPNAATYERLNGGLDTDNYDGGVESLLSEQLQPGTFSRGRTIASDDWEFVYAAQMSSGSDGEDDSYRVQMATIGLRYFLPTTVAFVMFHFEAFFRHDANLWDAATYNDADTPPPFDYWNMTITWDGTQQAWAVQRLPYGNIINDPPATDAPPQMPANQWRYVCKSPVYIGGDQCAAGWHTVRFSLWCKPIAGADAVSKLKTLVPTASATILALGKA